VFSVYVLWMQMNGWNNWTHANNYIWHLISMKVLSTWHTLTPMKRRIKEVELMFDSLNLVEMGYNA
jgi:hypothetical protein